MSIYLPSMRVASQIIYTHSYHNLQSLRMRKDDAHFAVVHTAERYLADPYDIERQDIYPEVYTVEFWL